MLTHSTGLQHAFPDKATFDKVCDWGEVQRTLEDAQPAWPPGSRASYHYFTFGWLVAAVVERVAGVPFGKVGSRSNVWVLVLKRNEKASRAKIIIFLSVFFYDIDSIILARYAQLESYGGGGYFLRSERR